MKIIVLDDLVSRVDYLRQNFPGATIYHSTNVGSFLSDLESLINDTDLKVIILDHDLDMDRFLDPSYVAQTDDYGQIIRIPKEIYQRDRHGKDGRDAANAIPITKVPILIWSHNTKDSITMEETLRAKGNNVTRLPFHTYPEKLIITIETYLKH